jgi:complement component 1 Q subcomponent-binding protein
MLSFRTLARSAPRALCRATASASARPASSYLRPSASTLAKTSLRPLIASRATFATTVARRAAAAGETDDALSAKLSTEIEVEDEMNASQQQPASIRDFLDNSPFELIDTPGEETVKLVRNFGDEKITVSFSIADVTNYDPLAEEEEGALEDEDAFDNDGKPSNDRAAANEQEVDDEYDDLEDGSTPISMTIIVEKPGKTDAALNIDATAQNGAITVDNMFYYDDAKLARIDTPDAAQRRADVYPGPPFGSLDEDLQVLMEQFLEERGVTQALAVFVPDYVDAKEQKEYVRWLHNVKAFVDA